MKNLAVIFILLVTAPLYAQTPGNALNFDGTNDMVVCNVPPFFNNIGTTDFTFEAWVYPSGAIFSRIIFAQPSTTNFATLSTSASNQIYFYVVDGGTTYSIATSTTMPTNQWTHVAGVWTSATNTVQVYFNGVLQPGGAGGTSSTGTNGLMTIGTRPGGFQYFPGSLDDIRVWSEARTQCEIQANMNAEFTSAQPNLVAYYNCNQGIPAGPNAPFTNLPDINGTYNGTLTNFALSGATSNWIASGAVINSVGPNGGVTSSISNTICAGDTFMFGGQPLTTSGTYMDTTTAAGGCDSIITLNLTVLSANNTNISVAACEQYTFNSTLLTTSGMYYDTLPAFNGCDSTITLDLTINNTQNSFVNATSCDQYMFNSTLLTSTGTYFDTLTTINGCDSIVQLDLLINNSQTVGLTETACDQYIFNSMVLTSSGMYADTLSTFNGCDSVITLDLTINSADVSVNQAGSTLTANAVGATYQWLDCNNSFAIIPSETNAVYNATANGDYAVQVTENGCTDTSACFTVVGFGIDPATADYLKLYPNPSDGILYLQMDAAVEIETVRLVNVNGVLLQTFTVSKDQLTTIDLTNYSSGIYFLQAFINEKPANYRIVKK